MLKLPADEQLSTVSFLTHVRMFESVLWHAVCNKNNTTTGSKISIHTTAVINYDISIRRHIATKAEI